mmetsp:Transcript_29978/g.86965  ORF Transcript_29978/g.86965 Transcript_29978/m.86965 type:complete len:200 (-) Transcript_29978:1105-1704(-)
MCQQRTVQCPHHGLAPTAQLAVRGLLLAATMECNGAWRRGWGCGRRLLQLQGQVFVKAGMLTLDEVYELFLEHGDGPEGWVGTDEEVEEGRPHQDDHLHQPEGAVVPLRKDPWQGVKRLQLLLLPEIDVNPELLLELQSIVLTLTLVHFPPDVPCEVAQQWGLEGRGRSQRQMGQIQRRIQTFPCRLRRQVDAHVGLGR